MGDEAWGVTGESHARLAEAFIHDLEDVLPSFKGLIQCVGHDLLRESLNLDVHLQGGHAFFGANNLEVHVAQMVLVA